MSVIERSPRIETRRLALRAPDFGDAGRIAALANDLDVARMTTRLPHPYGRDDAESFLARMADLDHQRVAPIGQILDVATAICMGRALQDKQANAADGASDEFHFDRPGCELRHT